MFEKKIAVIIPCFNEGSAIRNVIREFQSKLPSAEIYIYDNLSTDNTVEEAESCGARVFTVIKRGKGNVVREMFRDVDADYYVMVDGDGTYPAEYVIDMISLMRNKNADMVVGSRINDYQESNSRIGHHFGNLFITRVTNFLFDTEFSDVLSGYRVLSYRFVKSAPLFVEGFEVETALSVHAVAVDAKVVEIPIKYRKRAAGTESKLHTLKDGFRIAMTLFRLFKNFKPMMVYGILSLILLIFSLLVGIPVIYEFMETRFVTKVPSSVLASGLMLLSFMSFFAGIILDSLSKSNREIKKLAFLSVK